MPSPPARRDAEPIQRPARRSIHSGIGRSTALRELRPDVSHNTRRNPESIAARATGARIRVTFFRLSACTSAGRGAGRVPACRGDVHGCPITPYPCPAQARRWPSCDGGMPPWPAPASCWPDPMLPFRGRPAGPRLHRPGRGRRPGSLGPCQHRLVLRPARHLPPPGGAGRGAACRGPARRAGHGSPWSCLRGTRWRSCRDGRMTVRSSSCLLPPPPWEVGAAIGMLLRPDTMPCLTACACAAA
jgi:hypothetical protein